MPDRLTIDLLEAIDRGHEIEVRSLGGPGSVGAIRVTVSAEVETSLGLRRLSHSRAVPREELTHSRAGGSHAIAYAISQASRAVEEAPLP